MPIYLPQEIDRNKVGYLFANRHFHTSLKIFTLALLLLNFELGPPLEQSLMMMHSQARRNPGEEEGLSYSVSPSKGSGALLDSGLTGGSKVAQKNNP